MGKFKAIADALKRLSSVRRDAVKKDIEEAGKDLNKLNMKEVDEVSAPIPPKNPESTPDGLNRVDITDKTRENIEAISRVQGNRELRENAMDRALARPTKEISPAEPTHTMESPDLEH
jgi:hypothetical protein